MEGDLAAKTGSNLRLVNDSQNPNFRISSYFWSERRCAFGALQQGNAVTSVFVVIFSFQLITQHVVVVVNLAKYRVIISK